MNKTTGIEVKFKELKANGCDKIITKEYRSWEEDGSYTAFYDDISLDSIAYLVPTRNIISIKIIKEG